MKHIGWVFFLSILLSSTSFADTTQTVQDQSVWMRNMVGSYTGARFNVHGAGEMATVVTTFFMSESGELGGEYAIGEDDGLTLLGALSNFRAESQYVAVVDWKDPNGSGVLRMIFSSDYTVFQGFWGTSETETVRPWYGTKKELIT